MTRALITGITGQDGSYLTELLLGKGYEVHGLVRRSSARARGHLDSLLDQPGILGQQLFLHWADLDDPTTLRRVLIKVAPDEIYHLAGQSHVGLSFEIPEATCAVTAMATLRLLELMRDLPRRPRFFHASSSEVFGRPTQAPQSEQTPFIPVNPYGCAKAFATQMVAIYRQSFECFACNGILFNHESPRRGERFVTRKICGAAAAIKLGLQQELSLGDTSARRDWGHARDYARAMWLMLQQPTPEDFVLATGRLHSVREVVEQAFARVQLDWRRYVRQDPSLIRAAEPVGLVGDPGKAQRLLGWEAATPFDELIAEMTDAELSRLQKQQAGASGPS